MPLPRALYVCRICGYTWYGRADPVPLKCPSRACRTRLWQRGVARPPGRPQRAFERPLASTTPTAVEPPRPSAVLRYTCRRCRQSRESRLVPHANPIEALTDLIVRTDQRRDLGLLSLHHCPDGGYGIADLIGADVREE